jgi:hypothetical protein
LTKEKSKYYTRTMTAWVQFKEKYVREAQGAWHQDELIILALTMSSGQLGAEGTGISCLPELVMRLRENGSREIFITGIRYQATTDEDIEDCICAAVQ